MTQTRSASRLAGSIGSATVTLSDDDVRRFVIEQLADVDLDGRSLCLLVPDATRSAPLPLLVAAVHAAVHGRVSRLTVLVALGTHSEMSEAALAAHLGYEPGGLADRYAGTTVINHAWWEPSTFVTVGAISEDRIAELSNGMLRHGTDVRVNRAVVEHDLTLVVGPVFPHEVVGFSGGNKYFFPGVSGGELIDLSHWLGALITNARLIGTLGMTPVRAMFDEAASMLPNERIAFCVVTDSSGPGLHSIAFGTPEQAWQAAAEVSAKAHIRYLDKPVSRVLSIVPHKYDDLWTGAKGFYKVEPIVADGGQVVLYAPHIREISATHPQIEALGYHCRDFFVKQWDSYEDFHWADLAHSTHLRGAGSYDPDTGEHARVTVTLATGIPEAVVRSVNLDYLDPAEIDIAAWESAPDTLVVPNAGEDLYRLREPSVRHRASPTRER